MFVRINMCVMFMQIYKCVYFILTVTAHVQVVQRHRDMFKVLQNQQMDAKKCVQMCQKRYRKDALASLKTQRDFMLRARKVSKDAGTIWRRENAQVRA